MRHNHNPLEENMAPPFTIHQNADWPPKKNTVPLATKKCIKNKKKKRKDVTQIQNESAAAILIPSNATLDFQFFFPLL